jgi:hypothetical protein
MSEYYVNHISGVSDLDFEGNEYHHNCHCTAINEHNEIVLDLIIRHGAVYIAFDDANERHEFTIEQFVHALEDMARKARGG